MTFYIGILLQVALLAISTTILRDHRDHQILAAKGPKSCKKPYDYIVVGGGAAGAVVASRLSENKNLRVLLLEEGGVESIASDIPAMDLLNVLQPTDNLNQFLIEPQKEACLGFPERQVNMITGRILGGGSSVNSMMYNRGGKNDYDAWSQNYGASGWAYSDVLPFFRKSEDQKDDQFKKDSRHHAIGGYLTVTTTNISQATAPYRLLSDSLVSGASELGYAETDINGPNQLGATRIQRTIRHGKRLSTAGAFLRPAAERDNLVIVTGARVTKINFDNDGGNRAVSLKYLHKGQNHCAKLVKGSGSSRTKKVAGEIILSAGAINSAKLLLLSGIGPGRDLKNLKIPLIADLPVGQNFQDHTRAGGVDFVLNETVKIFTFWQDLLTVENLELLYVNKSGPLTSMFYQHQTGVINIQTNVSKNGADLFGPSDVFIAPALLPPGLVHLAPGAPNLKDEILTKYYGPYFGRPTVNFFSALNFVKSRGYVKLRSKDPMDPPIVNPRYLTERADVDRLVETHKFGLRLGQTKPFKDLGAEAYASVLPGCENFFDSAKSAVDQSDAYFECKIRHLSSTELHPCCSNRMGQPGDPMAVVDTRLRVKGVRGLRIADASIMPQIVTGNLMAPTIMIGEKAAAMILEDRGD